MVVANAVPNTTIIILCLKKVYFNNNNNNNNNLICIIARVCAKKTSVALEIGVCVKELSLIFVRFCL